jgi:histidinol-phosphate phosphatase family protein
MCQLKVDKSWTLFLDRDGVINKRNFNGYITHPKDFVFEKNVLASLPKLKHYFGQIIVITNQQGVGKKIMTESNLKAVHRYMLNNIEKEGGKINRIYCATNLRNALNDYRKPGIKMALAAQQDFPQIDFAKSVMVGDTDSDILFGKNNGMKTVLIRSKEKTKEEADFIIDDFQELLNIFNNHDQ